MNLEKKTKKVWFKIINIIIFKLTLRNTYANTIFSVRNWMQKRCLNEFVLFRKFHTVKKSCRSEISIFTHNFDCLPSAYFQSEIIFVVCKMSGGKSQRRPKP